MATLPTLGCGHPSEPHVARILSNPGVQKLPSPKLDLSPSFPSFPETALTVKTRESGIQKLMKHPVPCKRHSPYNVLPLERICGEDLVED